MSHSTSRLELHSYMFIVRKSGFVFFYSSSFQLFAWPHHQWCFSSSLRWHFSARLPSRVPFEFLLCWAFQFASIKPLLIRLKRSHSHLIPPVLLILSSHPRKSNGKIVQRVAPFFISRGRLKKQVSFRQEISFLHFSFLLRPHWKITSYMTQIRRRNQQCSRASAGGR